MTRPWLAQYPEGVPAEITIDGYKSLTQLLDRSCRKYAKRVACTAMGSDLSYADLDRQALAFAAWLQGLGLQKGARVALMMPNVPGCRVWRLGALRAGHVVVNVKTLYKTVELQRLLHDGEAEVIVILENFARTLQDVPDRARLRHVVITGPGDLLGGL